FLKMTKPYPCPVKKIFQIAIAFAVNNPSRVESFAPNYLPLEVAMDKIALFLTFAASVFAIALALPPKSVAEANTEAAITAQILKELQTQQAKLTDNQKLIDDKLSTVGEEIRLARAFSARGK